MRGELYHGAAGRLFSNDDVVGRSLDGHRLLENQAESRISGDLINDGIAPAVLADEHTHVGRMKISVSADDVSGGGKRSVRVAVLFDAGGKFCMASTVVRRRPSLIAASSSSRLIQSRSPSRTASICHSAFALARLN